MNTGEIELDQSEATCDARNKSTVQNTRRSTATDDKMQEEAGRRRRDGTGFDGFDGAGVDACFGRVGGKRVKG